MALADFRPRKRVVSFEGGEFEVRAITLNDVAVIVDSHRFTIDGIVSKMRARQGLDMDDPNIIADTMMEVVNESPILAANIIAICSDEREQMDAAARLPVPVTVEALQAIGDLTFTDMAAVKKFTADVMRLIRGILPPPSEALAAE